MGTILFNFLLDSLLFDERLISEDYTSISEEELVQELYRYREFCLESLQELQRELPTTAETLTVFSGTEHVPLERLKQSALYVERYLIDDPIFAKTQRPTASQEAMDQHLGIQQQRVDKRSLAQAASYVKALTPFVVADYVKLVPISLLFETPEQIPLYYSPTCFREALPEPLLEFFHSNAHVRTVERSDRGLLIRPGLLGPGRAISVGFEDHLGPRSSMVYFLQQVERFDVDKDAGRFSAAMVLPDDPPTPEDFKTWVYQSINRTACNVHDATLTTLATGESLGATYLTHSLFVQKLLDTMGVSGQGAESEVAGAFLQFEVPFLEDIDSETLMKVRRDETDAFQSFRRELERRFLALRGEGDPEQLRIKADNIQHEIGKIEVPNLDQRLRHLREKALTDCGLALGGLAGSFFTGGWTLLASGVAALRGFKTYSDYRQAVKLNPAYFLWKVLPKQRKRSR